jgi:hypothetical protein
VTCQTFSHVGNGLNALADAEKIVFNKPPVLAVNRLINSPGVKQEKPDTESGDG